MLIDQSKIIVSQYTDSYQNTIAAGLNSIKNGPMVTYGSIKNQSFQFSV